MKKIEIISYSCTKRSILVLNVKKILRNINLILLIQFVLIQFLKNVYFMRNIFNRCVFFFFFLQYNFNV